MEMTDLAVSHGLSHMQYPISPNFYPAGLFGDPRASHRTLNDESNDKGERKEPSTRSFFQ
jgi:hypothetical protein